MKLSYKAFLEWIDFPGTAEDLANLLSGLGFPNDGITHRGEGLDQVIVGKVLTKKKHPQADRLNLLSVDVGREKLPIVCGAHNMKEGDFVALAPVGARIPGKDGSGMTMKEAKIRGEISRGMCCSAAELKLSEESEGIILLPATEKDWNAHLGEKISSLLDWEDWILEIDITPNRGDALCVRGLAREVGAKLGLKLKAPVTSKWKSPSSAANPSIENFADAFGFAACLVQGVSVRETPDRWVRFLEKMGARSISNLVDITNIVMFELGHPLHFFDAEKIDPLTIGVRRARSGEKLELLNGSTIELHPEDLVIADSSGPLSLAGIMGGARTGVSETTKNILIEVASFNPTRIRATARRHNLSSESSIRFEKGLTPFRLDEVIERSLGLLKELSGFETAQGTKIVDKHIQLKTVLWDRARLESKLGKLSKTDDELFELLRRLEYTFEPKGSSISVQFPWYRTDTGRLESVAEDIARLIGYENLERRPLKILESIQVIRDLEPQISLADQISSALRSRGFYDVMEMSFTRPRLESIFGFSNSETVEIENPIHADRSVLRTHLLPGLVERAKTNAAHNEVEIRLAEIGSTFQKGASADSVYEESPVTEHLSMGCVWLSKPLDEKYLWSGKEDLYYKFKGALESVLGKHSREIAAATDSSIFHPNRHFQMGAVIAGEIHPRILQELDIAGRCFGAEWRIPPVAGRFQKPKYRVPTIYPPIDMDASFVMARELKVQALLDCFQGLKLPILEFVRPYDLFESKELGEGKKSVTFAMRYRDPERTLTLEEAKKAHESLVQAALNTFSNFKIALR